MRVYLFDTNSGLYEGEDYWVSGDVSEYEGVTILAPPKVENGQLLFYDTTIGDWKLVQTDSLKKTESLND